MNCSQFTGTLPCLFAHAPHMTHATCFAHMHRRAACIFVCFELLVLADTFPFFCSLSPLFYVCSSLLYFLSCFLILDSIFAHLAPIMFVNPMASCYSSPMILSLLFGASSCFVCTLQTNLVFVCSSCYAIDGRRAGSTQPYTRRTNHMHNAHR